jgi:hypothetical protein
VGVVEATDFVWVLQAFTGGSVFLGGSWGRKEAEITIKRANWVGKKKDMSSPSPALSPGRGRILLDVLGIKPRLKSLKQGGENGVPMPGNDIGARKIYVVLRTSSDKVNFVTKWSLFACRFLTSMVILRHNSPRFRHPSWTNTSGVGICCGDFGRAKQTQTSITQYKTPKNYSNLITP